MITTEETNVQTVSVVTIEQLQAMYEDLNKRVQKLETSKILKSSNPEARKDKEKIIKCLDLMEEAGVANFENMLTSEVTSNVIFFGKLNNIELRDDPGGRRVISNIIIKRYHFEFKGKRFIKNE